MSPNEGNFVTYDEPHIEFTCFFTTHRIVYAAEFLPCKRAFTARLYLISSSFSDYRCDRVTGNEREKRGYHPRVTPIDHPVTRIQDGEPASSAKFHLHEKSSSERKIMSTTTPLSHGRSTARPSIAHDCREGSLGGWGD